MANNVTRMTPQQTMPVPGAQDGNWIWDGTQWVCSTCDGVPPFPFCPPPGFPPAGCPPWFSGMNSPPWYPGANAGVSFGNSAPLNPVRGHFWWNGVVLAMFDGAAWVNTNGGGLIVDGSTPAGTGGVIISSTAPGNPTSGTQWWDGSVMRVFDGVQWKIVGPGGAAGPVPTTTKVFSITQPTNLAMSSAVWMIVPFTATPSLDSTLAWNATTHVIRPTRAGTYMFLVRGLMGTGGAGGNLQIALLKNDTGNVTNSSEYVTQQSIFSATAVVNEWMSTVGIALMNGTSDFVRLFAYNSGTDLQFYGAGLPQIDSYLLP